jgi:hypothetical protein
MAVLIGLLTLMLAFGPPKGLSARIYTISALWPAALLPAALLGAMDRASDQEPFRLSFSWAACIFCLTAYAGAGLSIFWPKFLGLEAPVQLLGMAAILSGFAIVVPFREVMGRLAAHRLAVAVVLTGVMAPFCGRYVTPLLWEYAAWADAAATQVVSALADIGTQVDVRMHPHFGTIATVRSDRLNIRLVRFCSALDHVRVFIPILSAFILYDQSLPSVRRVVFLYAMLYPFTLIANAIRIALILAFAELRATDLFAGSVITVSDLHQATSLPYLIVSGIVLYLLYRSFPRLRTSRIIRKQPLDRPERAER